MVDRREAGARELNPARPPSGRAAWWPWRPWRRTPRVGGWAGLRGPLRPSAGGVLAEPPAWMAGRPTRAPARSRGGDRSVACAGEAVPIPDGIGSPIGCQIEYRRLNLRGSWQQGHSTPYNTLIHQSRLQRIHPSGRRNCCQRLCSRAEAYR